MTSAASSASDRFGDFELIRVVDGSSMGSVGVDSLHNEVSNLKTAQHTIVAFVAQVVTVLLAIVLSALVLLG
jgi:hypothetical protein